MKSAQEVLAILAQQHGTTQYHKVSIIPGAPVATDGIVALATAAGCFWLLDIIVSHQTNKKLDKHFQVWKFAKNKDDDGAVVRGYNDTTRIVTQKIPFTDFPLDEIKLYLIDGVILLPSEY